MDHLKNLCWEDLMIEKFERVAAINRLQSQIGLIDQEIAQRCMVHERAKNQSQEPKNQNNEQAKEPRH